MADVFCFAFCCSVLQLVTVVCNDGTVRALASENGMEEWSHQGSRGTAVGLSGGGEHYYVCWKDGSVSALHWKGGAEVWRVGGSAMHENLCRGVGQSITEPSGKATAVHMPSVDNQAVLTTWSEGKVAALSVKTGSSRWTMPLRDPATMITGESSRCFVLAADGAMECIQFSSEQREPQKLWRFNGSEKESPGIEVFDDESDEAGGVYVPYGYGEEDIGRKPRKDKGGSCECVLM